MSKTTATDLLTPQEAAARLRANIRTLERWRMNGEGPRFVKLGLRVFYRPADLDAFIERNVRSGTGQVAAAR